MSAGLPYLSKLRKTDLTEFAEASRLPSYSNLKKNELEIALDDHLRANQTTYANDPTFSDYYKRLGSSSRSPAKKIADKVTEMVKSEDEAPPVKKQRRKTTSAEDKSAESSALIKTPAAKEIARKSSNFAASIPLPPSPAVVTDAIERQTARLRHSVSQVYQRSQITEYSDYTRALLSSPLTVNIIGFLVEAYGINKKLIGFKSAFYVPAIKYVKDSQTDVYIPDLFKLLGLNFWAPFTLWLSTTLLVPLAVSYFVNLPLKTSVGQHATRRSTSAKTSPDLLFDPFVFNIAKAVIAYVVYAQHFDLGGLYSAHSITTVDVAMLGGYHGMITTAAIGGVIALYDAVLKK